MKVSRGQKWENNMYKLKRSIYLVSLHFPEDKNYYILKTRVSFYNCTNITFKFKKQNRLQNPGTKQVYSQGVKGDVRKTKT